MNNCQPNASFRSPNSPVGVEDDSDEEESRAEDCLIGARPRLNTMESSFLASNSRGSQMLGKEIHREPRILARTRSEIELAPMSPPQTEPDDDLFEEADEKSDGDIAEMDRCQSMNLEYLRLLFLLLWKNLWLQSFKRHYIVTAFEVFLPLIFTLIFAFINATFDHGGSESPNITVYAPMGEKELMRNLHKQIECPHCLIAYAPKSEYTEITIDKLRNLFTDPDYNPEAKNSTTVWRGFNSELELEADWQLHVQSGNRSFKAAIIFDSGFSVSPWDEMPKNHTFSYTIRIPELSDEIDLITGMYRSPEQNASDPYPKVASALQILVDKVLVDQIAKDGFPSERILLQAFPQLRTAVTNSQTIGKYFNAMFPVLLSLGFIFIIPSVVGAIVREKESGMRELLRANGLPRGVNWLGWMLKSIMVSSITLFFVCFLLFVPFNLDVGAIVKDWRLYLPWQQLLFLFGIAATSWCVLISSLFDQMIVAVAAGMYVWVLSYSLWAATFLYQLGTGWKYVFSIFPNLALTFGAEILLKLDEARSSSEGSSVLEDLKASFYIIVYEMLAFTLLYVVLCFYLENVLPTRFGARRRWNFFIRPPSKVCEALNRGRRSNVENVSSNVVRTYRLKKVFRGKTVDYASVRFESNQTTVLLGENGAGKSTLLSMLAGIQLPTEGYAYVNGRSIETIPKLERQCVGYCPQINTSWNDLTVGEHVQFFKMLKMIRTTVGCRRLLRQPKLSLIEEFVCPPGLSNEVNKLPSALSGGQKRRLNVAMAMAGDPAVLLLDEPMSGVDPGEIERLLYYGRSGRTTVITSHVMREMSGERWRVAVFDKGTLKMVKKGRFVDYMNRPHDVTNETDTVSSVSPSVTPFRNENVGNHGEAPILESKRLWRQFRALLRKRFLQAKRNKRLLIMQFVIPWVVSIIAICAGNQIRGRYSSQPNATRIDLATYQSPIILFSSGISTQHNEEIFTSLVSRGAEKVVNVTETLVQIAMNDSQRYRDNYIIAVELDSFEVKAGFSSTRSAPVALNLAGNYILRTKTGNDRPSIQVYMNPLTNKVPADLDAANPMPTFVTRVALVVVATLPVGLAILAAGYVVVPVAERASKVKLLQLMTGVSGSMYWVSSFTWDFSLMAGTSGLLTFLIAFIGSVDTFFDKAAMGVMFLMFLAYGFAAICFSYLVSSISRQLSNAPYAFTVVMTIHFLSGTIGTTVVYCLEILGLVGFARTASYCFSLLPSFAISWSILRFTEIATSNSRCRAVGASLLEHLCDKNNAFDLRYRSCCIWCKKFFPRAPCFESQPYLELYSTRSTGQISIERIGIGMEILIMVAVGFLCLLMLAMFSRRGAKISTDKSCSPTGLKASNICKSYESGPAVSKVNIEAKPGELFALVGHNGAGKSATLRILAGDELPSQGRVRIGHVSIERNWRGFSFLSKKYLSQIGYCPQHDGLIETLTAKEILEFFAKLLGLEQREIQKKVDHWIEELGLESAKNTQCRNLTGGMKRRLSLAVALIGSPTVVVLDEPTAGVDPKGRKRLWNIIDGMKSPSRSIIVSTHDIEECGKICSNFGFMRGGSMRGIGDVNKNYFDVIVSREGDESFMVLRAIAAKYRPAVDEIGCAKGITVDKTRDKFVCWLSLRVRDNEDEMQKFQHKILDEPMLHAGDFGPDFMNDQLPRRSFEEAENVLIITKLFDYLEQKHESYPYDYTGVDIEPQIGGIQNDAVGEVLAPAKYSISRQREWFKSVFDKARFQVSDPMDGESCNSEENLRSMMSPPLDIGIVPLLAMKISNHLTWDLEVVKGPVYGPEQDLGYGRHAFKGPGVVREHTTQTFHFGKNNMGIESGPAWLRLGSQRSGLIISCMELEHGGLVLSAGFRRSSNYHHEHLPAEAVQDLPICPDACTIRIASLTAQYESFAKFDDFVIRVQVPIVPQGILRRMELDIVEIEQEVEMALALDERRSIHLDRIFWNTSFEFQFYYVQPLLRLLNNPLKWNCVAIVDIENALNVSLTRGTEKIIANSQDRQAGTSNSCRAEIREPRKLNPPTEIFASTREIFYECGCMPIQRMFSYNLESTDLSIVVGLKVQEKDSSFSFAFVESSAVENETFETLMDPSKSNDRRHRKFGYAKNGEEAVQIRNIIASVSMTEPKSEMAKVKCRPSQRFELFKDQGHNVNSQLNIRIFTF